MYLIFNNLPSPQSSGRVNILSLVAIFDCKYMNKNAKAQKIWGELPKNRVERENAFGGGIL